MARPKLVRLEYPGAGIYYSGLADRWVEACPQTIRAVVRLGPDEYNVPVYLTEPGHFRVGWVSTGKSKAIDRNTTMASGSELGTELEIALDEMNAVLREATMDPGRIFDVRRL